MAACFAEIVDVYICVYITVYNFVYNATQFFGIKQNKKPCKPLICKVYWSKWRDSNPRPFGPAPKGIIGISIL